MVEIILFCTLGIVLMIGICPIKGKEERLHRKTDYYQMTKNPLRKIKEDKGLYGEYVLFNHLNKINEDFRIVPNIYIPSKNGITEIDLVLIHRSGLYIFENKNFKGKVTGGESERNWIQTLGHKKTSFFSPILQNKGHVISLVKHISRELGYDYIPHYSFITFPNETELDIGIIYDKFTNVVKLKDVNLMLNYLMGDKYDLCPDEIDDIYTHLISRTQVTHKEKMIHLQTVKRAIKKSQEERG